MKRVNKYWHECPDLLAKLTQELQFRRLWDKWKRQNLVKSGWCKISFNLADNFASAEVRSRTHWRSYDNPQLRLLIYNQQAKK